MNMVHRDQATQDDQDMIGHINWPLESLDSSITFPQGRYKVIELIGSGTYGRVIACLDQKYRVNTAIKVVRRTPEYREAAIKEIRILRDLDGKHFTPKLLRDFNHKGHLCLVFNYLGEDLSTIISRL